jgi:hypothetical protein
MSFEEESELEGCNADNRGGALIFSPSHTWPHQHSPASLIMQTPDPQQRLSGAFMFHLLILNN